MMRRLERSRSPKRLRPALGVLLALGVIGGVGVVGGNAAAQQNSGPPSQCLAIAQDLNTPGNYVRFANFDGQVPVRPANDAEFQVKISFQGHSTYLIESPKGVKVATDYAGWMTDPGLPTAVTMNHAHSTHYTDFPDPKIKHVFRGWPDAKDQPQGIARHNSMVGDVLIRNVTTDILRFGNRPDGNSIFIFETAGLCIGHLGHLHHKLTDDHFAKIGRLDVVMVPIDGGTTMTHVSAREILKRLRSSVILPMHVRSVGALPYFLNYMKDTPVVRSSSNALTVSLRNLPKQPTIYILAGIDGFAPPSYD